LLDLDYNLPVQVRDYALGLQNDDEPQSEVGKEFQLQKKIDEGSLNSSFAQQRPNDLLLKMQRTTPYYKVRKCRMHAR
jgi:pre-mRNA-splicing factor RBM22/SLT11